MINIDISRFRVIYGNKVLNALCIMDIWMPDADTSGRNRETIVKPKIIEILAINADGEIVSIQDEAWTFQFVPVVTKRP